MLPPSRCSKKRQVCGGGVRAKAAQPTSSALCVDSAAASHTHAHTHTHTHTHTPSLSPSVCRSLSLCLSASLPLCLSASLPCCRCLSPPLPLPLPLSNACMHKHTHTRTRACSPWCRRSGKHCPLHVGACVRACVHAHVPHRACVGSARTYLPRPSMRCAARQSYARARGGRLLTT